jgi:hypothetical protein
MLAKLKIDCYECKRHLGGLIIDTAFMPDELQKRINHIILNHRDNCKYYGGDNYKNISKGKTND